MIACLHVNYGNEVVLVCLSAVAMGYTHTAQLLKPVQNKVFIIIIHKTGKRIKPIFNQKQSYIKKKKT